MTKNPYITNDKVVVMCDSNIARMNIVELLYYSRHQTIDDVEEVIKETGELLQAIGILITCPVSFPIMAYLAIRDAKKAVDARRRE